MRHWIVPVGFAVCGHFLVFLLLLLGQFNSKPARIKPAAEKNSLITSYLVVAPPKRPDSSATSETLEPENTVVVTEPVSNAEPSTNVPEEKVDSIIDAKKSNSTAPTANEPKISEAISAKTSESGTRRRLSQQQLMQATRSYLSEQAAQPDLNWQTHQQQELRQKLEKMAETKSTESFLPKISGIREIAVSADGSRLVKYGDRCVSISRNEFGDQQWLNATCPNSADETRELLRKSLAKYGIGKK